jgi:ribosomal protein S18 acetylase RimI-like enzyme
MRIRAVEQADRDRIRQILIDTDRFTPDQLEAAVGQVDQALQNPEKADFIVFVIEEGAGRSRSVSGYACYGPTPRAEGVYDLYWIAVDPKRQGHGCGRRLLRFVEAEVKRRDGRMLLIETSSKDSYRPAVSFYTRAGYRETSRIKDFYRIEDDKIIFSKTFR